MIKKTIRRTPDQMGYHDRGKMKWQGLILSDHTEAIKRNSPAQQEQNILPKTRLSLDVIGKKLSYVYQKKLPICLQTNILTSESELQEYYCLVAGYYENNIYFILKNGNRVKVALEDIRHLELIDPIIWQMIE